MHYEWAAPFRKIVLNLEVLRVSYQRACEWITVLGTRFRYHHLGLEDGDTCPRDDVVSSLIYHILDFPVYFIGQFPSNSDILGFPL